MVKLQKQTPKKLGNKPKLDNPIKQKKQQLKKEKSATTNKAKLLDDSTPVKLAKTSVKPDKAVITKNQHKNELNGGKKTAKKPLILAPESPEQKQNGKGKKNQVGKGKNVATNGVEKTAKSIEVAKKVNKKVALPQKASVSVKEVKVAPVQLAPAIKGKAAPVPAPSKPTAPKKKAIAPQKQAIAPKKQAIAPQIKTIAPQKQAIAPEKKAIATEKKAIAPEKKAIAPEKKAIAPQKKAIALQKKAIAPPLGPLKAQKTENGASQKKAAVPIPNKSGKQGKKQKNKKKAAAGSEPETVPVLEKIKKPKIALQEKKKAKIAFKLKTKQANQEGQPKKEKKPKVGTTFRFDPIPYDEDQFNAIVNVENIKKIAQALKTTVEQEVKKKKSSIFEDYRYFLDVASFKIPNCPKRMVRLNLKHPLVDKDDDILLVVPDLQRGAKVDYEPTKQHYEDLLRQNGVQGITIMPMNQLHKEHGSFEARRRLFASYEYFMCDGRVMAQVRALMGNFTKKSRTTFQPVRLNKEENIKSEIEKSLKKTAFRQLEKGSLQSILVGSHKFSTEQLAENIELVLAQLKKVFPGGLGNIRSMYLKIDINGTSSLPLYISMAQAPEETPMLIGPREERMIKLKREANEVLSKFSMTKEGKLIKLTKPQAEKKRKLQEMKAALKADEDEEPAKKAKKSNKESVDDGKKKKVKEVKELELPDNEGEEDDDTSDEDNEDVIQLGQGSDDETEDDEMANVDEEDTESGAEIVENGFVGEDDEESGEDDEQEVNQSENDEDDDDDEEEDDDDDDEAEDDEEESD